MIVFFFCFFFYLSLFLLLVVLFLLFEEMYREFNKQKKNEASSSIADREVPDFKGGFYKRGFTPNQILAKVADKGSGKEFDSELPRNLATGGLDRDKPNFGLMPSTMFPGKKKMAFTTEKFNLILEQEILEPKDSFAFQFQPGSIYSFQTNWSLSYVRKNTLSSAFLLPTRGSELVVQRKGGESLEFTVVACETLGRRASFIFVLLFVK